MVWSIIVAVPWALEAIIYSYLQREREFVHSKCSNVIEVASKIPPSHEKAFSYSPRKYRRRTGFSNFVS